MGRPKKLKTAEQIEAERLIARSRDLEAVGVQPEAATLPRQADIEVTRGGEKREARKVEGDQARRLDAFAALKQGMAHGAYDAARRLETEILIRRGENDKGQATSRVDRTAGLTTDAMIDAAKSIEAIQQRLSDRDWWLLNELICPAVDRGTWRDHVWYITGEKHSEGQAAAVRATCVNLREAYAMCDRAKVEKRRAA